MFQVDALCLDFMGMQHANSKDVSGDYLMDYWKWSWLARLS